MTTNTNNSENKNDNYSSIRVKGHTKILVINFLKKVNKLEDSGKVTPDSLVTYLLENVTKEDIEKLQLRSTTWTHEDKRLRKLWEKKKGKVSENRWKEMLYIGQLKEFISEHSRLQVSLIA